MINALSRATVTLGYTAPCTPSKKQSSERLRRDGRICKPSNWSPCYCRLPLLFDELYASMSKYIVVVDQVRSSWSVYLQKRRKWPARANSTLALIARKKIPHIFPWHENLSRVPRRIFPRGFPPPTCHTRMRARRKIRLARETMATPRVVGERERANLVVRTARFFRYNYNCAAYVVSNSTLHAHAHAHVKLQSAA